MSIRVLTAAELLDDVWRQRRAIHIRTYKPRMTIRMHEVDVRQIMMERRDIFGPDAWSERSMWPVRLFGEPLEVTDDVPPGRPKVA